MWNREVSSMESLRVFVSTWGSTDPAESPSCTSEGAKCSAILAGKESICGYTMIYWLYLCIYIYMYLFIRMYMYMCIFKCIYIYICMCICMYIYIYMYVYIYMYMCISICICIFWFHSVSVVSDASVLSPPKSRFGRRCFYLHLSVHMLLMCLLNGVFVEVRLHENVVGCLVIRVMNAAECCDDLCQVFRDLIMSFTLQPLCMLYVRLRQRPAQSFRVNLGFTGTPSPIGLSPQFFCWLPLQIILGIDVLSQIWKASRKDGGGLRKKKIYIYIYVCKCRCIYIYTRMYMYVYIYIYIYMYMYMCLFKCIYIYICMCICICKCICIYIYIYVCVYVYVNVCIYIYIRMYM